MGNASGSNYRSIFYEEIGWGQRARVNSAGGDLEIRNAARLSFGGLAIAGGV